jgi:predicted nucleic acid-binding Zn ribbon protein
MLKKVDDTSACKHCGAAFRKKRTGQEFCSSQCRNAAWNALA